MATTTVTVNVAESQNYLATSRTISVSSVTTLTDITVVPSQNGRLTQTTSYQSPTWNDYNSSQLTIGGTTRGKNAGKYSATFTPKSTYQWSSSIQSQYNVSAQGAITVDWYIIGYGVYGIKWTTDVAKGTRTQDASGLADPSPCLNAGNDGSGSSPFDYIYPWCDMKRVGIECTDFGYGYTVFVRIPKFWFKISLTSKGYPDIEISSTAKSGYSLSPAHRNRDGEGERDYIYASQNIQKNTGDIAWARWDANNTCGTYGFQIDFATYITIFLLFVVEMGYTEMSPIIGIGGGSQSSYWKYHTGTTASSITQPGVLRYRNIWNLTEATIPLEGVYMENGNTYLINNPKNYSSYNFSNGTLIGTTPSPSSATYEGLSLPFSGSDCDYILYGNGVSKYDRKIFEHSMFTIYSTSIKMCFFASCYSSVYASYRQYAPILSMLSSNTDMSGTSSSLFGSLPIFSPPNNYSHITSITIL